MELKILLDKKNPKVSFAKALAKGMPSALPARMRQALALAEREVKKSIRGSFASGAPELARSYGRKMSVTNGGRSIDARVTSTLPYARVQDEGTGYLAGGKITPKTTPKKRALAIPLDEGLKRGGIWPRHYAALGMGELFLLKRASRTPLLMDTETGEPKYALVPSVAFKGKQYIARAVKAMAPRLDSVLMSVYDLALIRGGAKR